MKNKLQFQIHIQKLSGLNVRSFLEMCVQRLKQLYHIDLRDSAPPVRLKFEIHASFNFNLIWITFTMPNRLESQFSF